MKRIICLFSFLMISTIAAAQENPFEKIHFVLGSWEGTGSGFGNSKSKIVSEFIPVMDGKYIKVKNDSKFEPTEQNPGGEKHIDRGMISFDKGRKQIVYRQFNIEGYVNQYVLIDSLSNESTIVFETENIENFVDGGKARYTIKKTGQETIETIFDVSFPGREYACFGTNCCLEIDGI